MKKTLSTLAATFLIVLATSAGNAQALPLVVYNPTGTYLDSDFVVPTNVPSGISASNATQTLPTSSGNTGVWPFSAPVGGVNLSKYISFTLQPTGPGVTLDLNNLSYSARSYDNSNLTLHLRSSNDGFAADIGSVNSVGTADRDWDAVFNLSGLPRAIATPIEFRLYAENTGPNGDWIDLNSTANAPAAGLVINRDFTPQQIPTLSQWGLLLLSSLLAIGTVFILRRQRQ